MAIILPELPYGKDALAPYISQNTIEFHYGKHHKTYVDNANKLLADTDMADASLEAIIQKTAGDAGKIGIFNNCAQVWNHSFYWKCMKPGGGGKPTGAIAAKIDATWGSFDKFAEEFKNAGATQFGSGWAWLVEDGGALKIVKTGQRRHAHRPRDETPVNGGCLGTRLLPRLPEPARGLPGHFCG